MNYFQSIFFCKLLVETVSKCARKKINIIEYYYVRTREQIEESKSNEWSGEEKNQIKSIAVKYSLQLALFLPPFFHIFRLFFPRKVFSRFFFFYSWYCASWLIAFTFELTNLQIPMNYNNINYYIWANFLFLLMNSFFFSFFFEQRNQSLKWNKMKG